MMDDRICHVVNADRYDLDMAIALELHVTADCGAMFIPKYNEVEANHFPTCVTCRSPFERGIRTDGRRRGSHRIPTHVLREMPHFVYRCFDNHGALLYVGCTYNPPARFRQHKAEAKEWMAKVSSVRILVFPNRRKALDMERAAIEAEHPIHNLQFKVKRIPA